MFEFVKGTEGEDLRGDAINQAIVQVLNENLSDMAGLNQEQVDGLVGSIFNQVDAYVTDDVASLNYEEIDQLVREAYGQLIGQVGNLAASEEDINNCRQDDRLKGVVAVIDEVFKSDGVDPDDVPDEVIERMVAYCVHKGIGIIKDETSETAATWWGEHKFYYRIQVLATLGYEVTINPETVELAKMDFDQLSVELQQQVDEVLRHVGYVEDQIVPL